MQRPLTKLQFSYCLPTHYTVNHHKKQMQNELKTTLDTHTHTLWEVTGVTPAPRGHTWRWFDTAPCNKYADTEPHIYMRTSTAEVMMGRGSEIC